MEWNRTHQDLAALGKMLGVDAHHDLELPFLREHLQLYPEPGVDQVPVVRWLQPAVVEEGRDAEFDQDFETGAAVLVDEFGEVARVAQDVGFDGEVVECVVDL